MRRAIIIGLGLAMLAGCGAQPSAEPAAADTSGPTTPDRDPYLAVNTALVANACSNCHAADYARVGPAMTDIAAAFATPTPADLDRLRKSILEGSTGKWGEAIMPPQRQVPADKVDALVRTLLTARPAA